MVNVTFTTTDVSPEKKNVTPNFELLTLQNIAISMEELCTVY